MVEGMAEYLSIGSVDANTAMWMRDAIINDDFPTLKEMTTGYEYFPYRYGHAFWAFVAEPGETLLLLPFSRKLQNGVMKGLLRMFYQ
jgi:hypothetical protein